VRSSVRRTSSLLFTTAFPLYPTFFARFSIKVQGAPRFIATATRGAVLSFRETAHPNRK
jgi:hypothetical protein